ncbi:MAG: hypothetical protein MUC92_10020 [Fimbriimonadaceae bacterium]|jgi:histidinol phosphatase-like enzyme (inositol monophosphatase family)|nr:hypothetical protein [Fimbriimonadaceae bacterium]
MVSPRLRFAIDAAIAAGKSTLPLFHGSRDYELKSDQTPVTAADRQAEEIIRQKISAQFPGETVLGEEQGLTGSGNDRWIIDPIDGTKSFVSGVPLYATLLSYEVDHQPILGVCYFPALDEILTAELGQGCFWNGKACQVSKKESVEGSVVCCAGHKGMAKHGRSDGMISLAQDAMATRTWCDAYGHALVATGRVEAMLDPVVSRWDVSAMVLIVKEAGGVATNFAQGDPLLPAHETGELELVTSNGAIHTNLLSYF